MYCTIWINSANTWPSHVFEKYQKIGKIEKKLFPGPEKNGCDAWWLNWLKWYSTSIYKGYNTGIMDFAVRTSSCSLPLYCVYFLMTIRQWPRRIPSQKVAAILEAPVNAALHKDKTQWVNIHWYIKFTTSMATYIYYLLPSYLPIMLTPSKTTNCVQVTLGLSHWQTFLVTVTAVAHLLLPTIIATSQSQN